VSSRFLKIAIIVFFAISLLVTCGCGDGSMNDEELAAFEDEMSWQLEGVDLKPLDDPDVESCEPGWDGC
jgi:hypothetical protein